MLGQGRRGRFGGPELAELPNDGAEYNATHRSDGFDGTELGGSGGVRCKQRYSSRLYPGGEES